MNKRFFVLSSVCILTTTAIASGAFAADTVKPDNRNTKAKISVTEPIRISNNNIFEKIKTLRYIDTLFFEATGSSWRGQYAVTSSQNSSSARLALHRLYIQKELRGEPFQYTIKVGDKEITGSLKFDAGGYIIKNLPVPENNNAVIKVFIDWDGKTEVLELKNQITSDVMSSEKAVEYLIKYYPNAFVCNIQFTMDGNKKNWLITYTEPNKVGTALGATEVDAVTGEITEAAKDL